MEKEKLVKPYPGMIINENIKFLPGIYNFFKKEGIIIKGKGIVVDGNGAVLIGGTDKLKENKNTEEEKKEFDYGYKIKDRDATRGFLGTGIIISNSEDVTLKNILVKNFELGLKIYKSEKINIENNDFSYNYTNPDWGWDEHANLGGILLEKSNHCILKNNKATDVWSALTLLKSDNNKIIKNNFSHTSNVGLRTWIACENYFEENDFSWGIRKEPFEVHARDSSSVLIESGSNNNKFYKNDMRYGGDGLFIRSLNGWMSTGNYFEENDTSFANNNAIEAWDSGNTYVRNKANYSSYGFWLGNSDNTTLIENEISYNGVGFKNAPESFGNAGLAVVNGSGTNFYVRGNKIFSNNGPGMAIRFKHDYPSQNWLISENEIFNNKTDEREYIGHGIYIKNSKNLKLINNNIYDNDGDSVYLDDNVSDVEIINDVKIKTTQKHFKINVNSKTFEIGKEYEFSIDEKVDKIIWKFNDEKEIQGQKIKKVFSEIGMYRLNVEVLKENVISFTPLLIFVLPSGISIKKSGVWNKKNGDFELETDKINFVEDDSSIIVKKNDNINKISFFHSIPKLSEELTHFGFYSRYMNDFIDWEKEIKTPKFRLKKDDNNYIEYEPIKSIFSDVSSEINESKYSWFFQKISLDGDENYQKKLIGNLIWGDIKEIEVIIETEKKCDIIYSIDGIRFYKEELALPIEVKKEPLSENLKIEKIGIKLHKEIDSKAEGLSPLHIEFCEFKDNIEKFEVLKEIILLPKDIKFSRETLIDFDDLNIITSKNYFIKLSQEKIANSLHEGSYYRWSGAGIGPMNENYGYFNNGVLTKRETGWGECWFNIYTNSGKIDFSHHNEGMGNRFGLKEMEQLYQIIKFENRK